MRPVPLLDLKRDHEPLAAEIRAAMARVLDSSAFIGGEEVSSFESEFATYCGARHCVGVANGTDALVLALRALGIGPGDAVLTPPFTFIAGVEAIDLVGATPVFADIDARDYNLDPAAAARVLETRPVKAVIAVHLYGQPCDVAGLRQVARAHGAALVEDAAQAQGARLHLDGEWKRAGALADVACFSFYPTKNLGALGDAGAVTTDDDALAERIRLLHDHAQARKYSHVLRAATNSRLDALQAAVLRLKLRQLDRWNQARRQVADHYRSLLAKLPLVLPWERPGAEGVYHQFVIRVASRQSLQERLRRRGIGTAVHYPVAVHLQDGYSDLGLGPGTFPVAEQAASEVLSLPMFPSLSLEEQEAVAEALAEALA